MSGWLRIAPLLGGLVLYLGLADTSRAQPLLLAEDLPREAAPAWTLTAWGGYAHLPAANGYGYGFGEVRYQGRAAQAGVRWHLNQAQHFQFAPVPVVFALPDGGVTISDEEAVRRASYLTEQPVYAFAAQHWGPWQIRTSLAFLIQDTAVREPVLREVEPSIYFLEFANRRRRSETLLGQVTAQYRWRGLHATAGLVALPVFRFGDADFLFAHRPRPQPYLGLGWAGRSIQAESSTDLRQLTARYRQALRRLRPSQPPVQATIRYQTGLRGFGFHRVALSIEVPLAAHLRAFASYQRVWTGADRLREQDFSVWQRTTLTGDGEALGSNLPRQHLQAGLRLLLQPRRTRLPLRLLGASLTEAHLFPAKRSVYQNNPVGHVTFHNPTTAPLGVQVAVRLVRGTATYRSPTLTLAPQAETTIPFHLHLDAASDEGRPLQTQVEVFAVVDGEAHRVTSLPATLYSWHAWSGHVRELRHFLTPDADAIRARAQRLYLAAAPHPDPPTPQHRFAQLQAFLTALGASLQYLPDATTTQAVDQVQYPVETLERGYGDCEDLSVFVASHLMAVGISVAAVDLRPPAPEPVRTPTASPRAYGHVFLLVDTGLAPGYLQALGLNELQAVTRPSRHGGTTLWLPIEPTLLRHGFARAFAAGTQQYYDEVIRPTERTDATVHVVDF